MLEKSLFESGGSARTRKPVTVLVSTILHACAILTLIVIPVLQPQVAPALSAAVGIALAEIPKPEPKVERVEVAPAVQPHIIPASSDLIAPAIIPSDIALVIDEPGPRTVASPPPVTFNDPRTMITKETEVAPPPPPPPPVIAPPTAGPLRVSNSQLGSLIYQVKPVYPDLAKRARVQGAVVLEATISKDGFIQNLRVVSGHVLLVDAAINAVQQWRYRPTMLNGEPIDVITTITVTFTLQ
jgi:protein TonB